MKILRKFISVFILLFSASAIAEPRLVVLLAVDQLRADRLTADLPGGLGRLVREGFVYGNATLDHGLTNTCPGHVVISTGVNPGKAGIPGNSYIDHETMAERYCVDDPGSDNIVIGGSATRSPNAITATTLGDWLKKKSPTSRVFSVSGKDRSAITLGGKQADGAFWYDQRGAGFTSSTYYGDDLPDYVRALNGSDFFVDGFAGNFPAAWTHGEGTHRADDYVGESQTHARKSAHPLNTGDAAERAERIYFSPFLDIATGELAKRIIEEEQLGQRGVTDLLAVSFSATDLVGHLYGPFSAESEDAIRYLDAEVGVLLEILDQAVGGDYILALTADHGVLPLPEWLDEQGQLTCPVEGGRISVSSATFRLLWHLYKNFTFPFGNPSKLIKASAAGLTVNRAYAEQIGVTVEEVVDSLEAYYETWPAMAGTWDQKEIFESDEPVARLYRNSYVVGKSGDLVPQLAETCLTFRPEGTSHGSPYMYDRHIPLVFFGQGIARGGDMEAVHSIDIAPTFGAHIGLDLPDDLDGHVRDVWD